MLNNLKQHAVMMLLHDSGLQDIHYKSMEDLMHGVGKSMYDPEDLITTLNHYIYNPELKAKLKEELHDHSWIQHSTFNKALEHVHHLIHARARSLNNKDLEDYINKSGAILNKSKWTNMGEQHVSS